MVLSGNVLPRPTVRDSFVVMVRGEMDKSLNDQLLLLVLLLLLGVTRLDTFALIACAAEVDEARRLDVSPEKEGKAGVGVGVAVATPLSSSSRPSIIDDAAALEEADPLIFADDDPPPLFHFAEIDPAKDDSRRPSKGSSVEPPIHPR